MRNRSLLVQLSVCLLLVLALSIQAMAAPITLRLMTVWGAEQRGAFGRASCRVQPNKP